MPPRFRLTPLVLALTAGTGWCATPPGEGRARPQSTTPVLIATNADEPALTHDAVLAFELADALTLPQGQLTVLVDGEDVGDFLASTDRRLFALPLSGLRLAPGSHALELVFEPRQGAPVRVLSVVLRVPARGAAAAEGVRPAPLGAQSGWRRKLLVQGTATHRPDGAAPATSHELALQLGLAYEGGADGSRLAIGSTFGATTDRERAGLNAGLLALDEPRHANLNDFLAEYSAAGARLSLGSGAAFFHPLLGTGFDPHGLASALRLADRFDLSLSAQRPAGADPLAPAVGFALARPRLAAGTLGWELVPGRPGQLRLELSGLSGRVEPDTAGLFGAHAEQGTATALRLQWSPPVAGTALEAGYARARLRVGAAGVGHEGELPESTSEGAAWYVQGQWHLGQLYAPPGESIRHASLALRHELAQPGYRSIAGGVEAGVRRTSLTAHGQWLGVQGQLQHSVGRGHAEAASAFPALETTTDLASLTLPLAGLFAGGALPAASPAPAVLASTVPGLTLLPPLVARQPSWWPTVLVGWQSNRQRPVGGAAGGESGDPLAALALRAASTSVSAQWSRGAWTGSLGASRLQRDGAVGAERARLQSLTRHAQLQAQLLPTVSAQVGLRRSSSPAFDGSQRQDGQDLGLQWHPGAWALGLQMSRNRSTEAGGNVAYRGQWWQLQASRQWLWPVAGQRLPVQLAVRWQHQDDRLAGFGPVPGVPTARREASVVLSTLF